MAYTTNIAYEIYGQLASVITTNIKDVMVANVSKLPNAQEDILPHLAKYGRSVLFRLARDEFNNEANDYHEVYYLWEIQCAVKYSPEDQQGIMNLSEEVKYWFQQNISNSTYWQYLRVDNIIYDIPEEDSNIHISVMNLRVLRDG